MIRVDLVLGAACLGVVIGVLLILSSSRLEGRYRRIGRVLLGVGLVGNRGYWGIWRFCSEYGLLETAAWMGAHQLTPALANGTLLVGAIFKLLAPYHDDGSLRSSTTALIFGGSALL